MPFDAGTSVSVAAVRDLLDRHAAQRRGRRGAPEPTFFLMDPDLVCYAASGESILRLPWFDDGLFVGRQVPDIAEMPPNVRLPAVANYRAALAGRRERFGFVSYGHAYAVDAWPVRSEGRISAVLGVATPERTFPAAAVAYERTARRLEHAAAAAEERADRYAGVGRTSAADDERERADRAWTAARRAGAHARHLTGGGAAPVAPAVTAREADVLALASHGLTSREIAEALVVSQGTVRTHLEHIYLKLGVSDKAAAVAAALRHGLIE
jgi:DNA-binding CsgD family transcriptional regulator